MTFLTPNIKAKWVGDFIDCIKIQAFSYIHKSWYPKFVIYF